MNEQSDANETTPVDEDGWLDPHEAAGVLERTQRETQRRLTSESRCSRLFSALVVLAVYGAIWSSSRGHHPYTGPSLDAIGVVYILVAVAALVSDRYTCARWRGQWSFSAGSPHHWLFRLSLQSSRLGFSMAC